LVDSVESMMMHGLTNPNSLKPFVPIQREVARWLSAAVSAVHTEQQNLNTRTSKLRKNADLSLWTVEIQSTVTATLFRFSCFLEIMTLGNIDMHMII